MLWLQFKHCTEISFGTPKSIKRLRDTTDFHPWKVLANLILKPVGGSSIFHSNLSLSKLIKQRIEQLILFYVNAINLFIQFAKVEDLRSNE